MFGMRLPEPQPTRGQSACGIYCSCACCGTLTTHLLIDGHLAHTRCIAKLVKKDKAKQN